MTITVRIGWTNCINLPKPRKLLNPELTPMKPKGVTTQMKALDEYFLMVVFMLLLNTVRVFVNFV